jgi:hypothetical protein
MLVNASHLTASPFNTFAYADLGRAVTGFFRLTHLNGLGGPGGEWVPDCDGDCGPIFELHPVFPKKVGAGDLTLETSDIPDKPSPGQRPEPFPVPEEEGGPCSKGKLNQPIGTYGRCACSVECCWGPGLFGRSVLRREQSGVYCHYSSGGRTALMWVNIEWGSAEALSQFCLADGREILKQARAACGSGPHPPQAVRAFRDCVLNCLKKGDSSFEDCIKKCLRGLGCDKTFGFFAEGMAGTGDWEICLQAMQKAEEDPLAKCCWEYVECIVDKCCPPKGSCNLPCYKGFINCMIDEGMRI